MTSEKREYELGCKDFGQKCDFTVRSSSESEILDKCQEHACNEHGKCSDSAEIQAKIKSRMREVL